MHESHGQKVLSIMGVNRPGEYVGSAPDADYWLFRSEHTGYEDILEEYYFVAAIELADSIGADAANVSLGFTTSVSNIRFTFGLSLNISSKDKG